MQNRLRRLQLGGSLLMRHSKRIRCDELALVCPHGEYWARRGAHHPFGDTTHEELLERSPAMCANDDQVNMVFFRVVGDAGWHRSPRFNALV